MEAKTIIDFSSEVNAMTPTYIAKLGLATRKISVGAQRLMARY